MKDSRVAIRRFYDYNQAEMYRALLKSEGIESEVDNEIASQMMGMITQVNVTVAAEDEEKAREILDAHFDEKDFDLQSGEAGKCR